MLHGSNIEGSLRRQLWAEAANTATELDQILVKYGVSENSFDKFFGTKAKGIVTQPLVFGEMVIVTDQTGLKSKLQDRGVGRLRGGLCSRNPSCPEPHD